MSLTLLASNNASTVLASSINASATTLTVNTGAGSLFPSPVSGTSFFKLTLIDAATGQLTEIVHVTARTGDVMTIERAQEGTAARVWSANDIAANMMTAGTLSYILGSFQPLDATLTALAALIGAADKLPYFNGPDTATLTALTGVGRDIIGKTTVAEVLSYLGLEEIAKAGVGTGFLSGNGYMKIPLIISGLKVEGIIQWGTALVTAKTTAGQETTQISFPVKFPSSCLQVVATHDDPNGSNALFSVGSLGSGSFWASVYKLTANGAGQAVIAINGSASLRYIAIGY